MFHKVVDNLFVLTVLIPVVLLSFVQEGKKLYLFAKKKKCEKDGFKRPSKKLNISFYAHYLFIFLGQADKDGVVGLDDSR